MTKATQQITAQRDVQGSFLHRFANPGRFLRLSRWLLPILSVSACVLLAVGLIWALYVAPADWQQGDAVRIMYIHVPMAILASSGYAALAVCGALSLVWKHPLADLAAVEIGPVGAVITALCLITGSLWGKPMWGTWWVWDARLTSVLVLFFLYLGHIALIQAFDDPQRGYRAAAVLALAGAIDLPIIKFSVTWWNTLHQPDSITLTHAPAMALSMLLPLAICMAGFTLGFAALVVGRVTSAILETRAQQMLTRRLRQGETA
ncbi:heme ABC transporter permease [Asaia krungthepensis]|uniref:Heme exporter protein C n=1 Tax=Asaia krungthepensis NRIC 0535 TaxID=1307925 RepID=A0ABQ0Q680_9PROT|nr:heme ABC transporter permease [Asaia krungthepensis]GBQ93252.1 heme exporter protein C [Asaia krungthepensis NRIC 0535]